MKTIQESNATKIILNANLNSLNTEELRNNVNNFCNSLKSEVSIDLQHIDKIDLSGINEIIHSIYITQSANKILKIIYKKNSSTAKWVEITNIDSLIETIIVE